MSRLRLTYVKYVPISHLDEDESDVFAAAAAEKEKARDRVEVDVGPAEEERTPALAVWVVSAVWAAVEESETCRRSIAGSRTGPC